MSSMKRKGSTAPPPVNVKRLMVFSPTQLEQFHKYNKSQMPKISKTGKGKGKARYKPKKFTEAQIADLEAYYRITHKQPTFNELRNEFGKWGIKFIRIHDW